MSRSHPDFRPVLALGLVAATLLAAGCSGSTEDVRITLCKDMVSTQMGSSQSPTWQEARAETRGYEDAAVRLRFSTTSGGGEAVCYYKYNAVDDTALTLSDPLSAYSTSPIRMTLNGRTLSRSELAEAIKQAMMKQGRELLSGSR